MSPAKFAALICLIVTMLARPCAAELLPGDLAITRIQGNVVSLMALRAIPSGEVIEFTDDDWIDGAFDDSGGTGMATLPAMQPGDQRLINLAANTSGISLEWEDTLHFYQTVTPAHASTSQVRHLLLIELRRDGLRWFSNIPDGLIRDVTHITLRERNATQGMNHIIHKDLLTAALTPFQWMRALGNFRAWQDPKQYGNPPLYEEPPSLSEWIESKLNVNSSPGIVSLPYQAQNFSEKDGQVFVPVRRSFGTSGNVSVNLSAKDQLAPFKRSQNETDSRFNADLTGVAYGDGIGFVAVSPNDGLIRINDGGGWDATPTNGTQGENLLLSGIMWDGSAFWACSLDGRIYKSGDGVNWSGIFSAEVGGARFFRIHYLPGADLPYVALGNNGLAAFSDDGSNWNLSETPNIDLYGATFFEGRYVLCGAGGTIIHTDNPGQSWVPASTPNNTEDLYSIAAVDFNETPTLLAVGKYGEMVSTIALEIAFTDRQPNTSQSLFDIIEASRGGGKENYVFAVGANGVTVASVNGSPFRTCRLNRRAPALYALAQFLDGEEPVIYAVGEYGSIIRFFSTPASLSGTASGVDLNGEGNSVDLDWDNGSSGEIYVKLTQAAALTQFRERIDLCLDRPASPGSDYRLGNDQSQINFFRSLNANEPPVADNFGPLLRLKEIKLEVVTDDEWSLSFRILNTSRKPSNRLFIRFEDTNLPDITIPASATEFPGSRIGEREESEVIQIPLFQPTESFGLYEEFRSGEEVLKAQVAINSLVASTTWTPNGIFPRSLGTYLQDNGSLIDPGVPGVGILGGGGSGQAQGEKSAGGVATKGLKSGFVFSGSAPTPPDNNPETPELLLLSVGIGGPIGMDVGDSYDYFLTGSFYNTGNGLNEDYSMNTVDWDVTESSSPAVGLSITDDTGAFIADAYPGVEYPRRVSIEALTTEGAPLDGEGKPVEYTDSQSLDINEPSSFRTYAEWVAANSLAGDDALESADPDGDKIVNLLEYALGTDPNAANPMNGIASSYDGDTGRMTFSFTIPNDLSAVMMKIETSANMSTWTERTMSLLSSDSSTETWGTTVTMGTKGFARMKVETYTP